jgi:cytochrome c553
MLQDSIMNAAMERAGSNNWLTAANAIMAAGKKAVAKLETVAGDGDDTGVIPMSEIMEETNKTVSSACGRCHKMSTCPRNCSINLFLEDLESILKTN